MPGTGDDAVLDVPAGERRAHMRTHIVDGEQPFATTEDGDFLARHDYGLAFALDQVTESAHGCEVRHRPPSLVVVAEKRILYLPYSTTT